MLIFFFWRRRDLILVRDSKSVLGGIQDAENLKIMVVETINTE